jgi:hypothetical protein
MQNEMNIQISFTTTTTFHLQKKREREHAADVFHKPDGNEENCILFIPKKKK